MLDTILLALFGRAYLWSYRWFPLPAGFTRHTHRALMRQTATREARLARQAKKRSDAYIRLVTCAVNWVRSPDSVRVCADLLYTAMVHDVCHFEMQRSNSVWIGNSATPWTVLGHVVVPHFVRIPDETSEACTECRKINWAELLITELRSRGVDVVAEINPECVTPAGYYVQLILPTPGKL